MADEIDITHPTPVSRGGAVTPVDRSERTGPKHGHVQATPKTGGWRGHEKARAEAVEMDGFSLEENGLRPIVAQLLALPVMQKAPKPGLSEQELTLGNLKDALLKIQSGKRLHAVEDRLEKLAMQKASELLGWKTGEPGSREFAHIAHNHITFHPARRF